MARKKSHYCPKVLFHDYYGVPPVRDDCIPLWRELLNGNRRNAFQIEFSTAEILGIPALFTGHRIDTDTIPNGFFSYEIRGNDDCSIPVEIAPFIRSGFLGTILVRERLVPDKTQRLLLIPGDMDMYGRTAYLRDWWCVYGI